MDAGFRRREEGPAGAVCGLGASPALPVSSIGLWIII